MHILLLNAIIIESPERPYFDRIYTILMLLKRLTLNYVPQGCLNGIINNYNTPGPVFSYKLGYIVGFGLVEIAISTNPKPTIYRNLYENTGPAAHFFHLPHRFQACEQIIFLNNIVIYYHVALLLFSVDGRFILMYINRLITKLFVHICIYPEMWRGRLVPPYLRKHSIIYQMIAPYPEK